MHVMCNAGHSCTSTVHQVFRHFQPVILLISVICGTSQICAAEEQPGKTFTCSVFAFTAFIFKTVYKPT